MATLPRVLINQADSKSAGGVALQLRIEAGLAIARDLQLQLAGVRHDRLAAISVAAVARLLAGEMMIHLGIQGSFRECLFQAVEKSVRIEGRLGIGPSQKLVQDGIRNMRLFASRHGWAPFHPSCPPTHEIPDSLRARLLHRPVERLDRPPAAWGHARSEPEFARH